MSKLKFQTQNLKDKSAFFRLILPLFGILFLSLSAFVILQNASAQNQIKAQTLPPTPFRIGERLTYNISFEKYNNAAYAEIYAVSRGKLGEKDAVELRSKIKTNDFVSAAFYLLDEARMTYASAENGLPLYVKKVSNAGILPKETIDNYLIAPTLNYDLLTLDLSNSKYGRSREFHFAGRRTEISASV